MELKEYEKATNLIHSFHHARAMEALKASRELDSASDEYAELWDEYLNHSQVCNELFVIQLKGLIALCK